MFGSGIGELFDLDGNLLGTVQVRVRLIRVLAPPAVIGNGKRQHPASSLPSSTGPK